MDGWMDVVGDVLARLRCQSPGFEGSRGDMTNMKDFTTV